MKLITESSDLVEAYQDTKTKKYFIEGIFLQSEIRNRNGRVYPKKIMEGEVNRYIREAVMTGRAVGELSHPDTPQINLDRISHKITELRADGHNYIGKAQITEQTPCGKIAAGLLEAGVKIGVSSRGVGSVKEENGNNVVQEDFRMAAIDIVADPSAPDAFVNGIMEGAEWVYENGLWREKDIEQTKKEILRASSRSLFEQKLAAWSKFLGN